MSNLRKDLDEILKKKKRYEKEVDDVYNKHNYGNEYEIEDGNLRAKIIFDENMLDNIKWEADITGAACDERLFLSCNHTKKLEALRKIYPDHTIYLDDYSNNIALYLNDGVWQLQFYNTKEIIPFINKHKLKVNASSLHNKRDELRAKAQVIDDLIKGV